MRLVIRPEARDDLRAIGDYIARDDPARAVSFIDDLEARMSSLSVLNVRHTIFAQSSRGLVFKMTHGRYLIFYRVSPGVVEVIHVRHGARDTPHFD